MDRRGFLRFLGLGAAAVAAPNVAYSFLGGILRPRLETRPMYFHMDTRPSVMSVHIETLHAFYGVWERVKPTFENGILVADVPVDARYVRFCATYNAPASGTLSIGPYIGTGRTT